VVGDREQRGVGTGHVGGAAADQGHRRTRSRTVHVTAGMGRSRRLLVSFGLQAAVSASVSVLRTQPLPVRSFGVEARNSHGLSTYSRLASVSPVENGTRINPAVAGSFESALPTRGAYYCGVR
jgi:hypothetical protein